MWSASTVATASSAPAAPSACPCIDFVELTARLEPRRLPEHFSDGPRLGAVVSGRSGAVSVDVADASGGSPASASAARMARDGPATVGWVT